MKFGRGWFCKHLQTCKKRLQANYSSTLWPGGDGVRPGDIPERFDFQCPIHRHLRNIDCLTARTACLVMNVSFVSCRSRKKEEKKAILRCASSGHSKQTWAIYFTPSISMALSIQLPLPAPRCFKSFFSDTALKKFVNNNYKRRKLRKTEKTVFFARAEFCKTNKSIACNLF